jgi:hypothetical protein
MPEPEKKTRPLRLRPATASSKQNAPTGLGRVRKTELILAFDPGCTKRSHLVWVLFPRFSARLLFAQEAWLLSGSSGP